MYVNFINVCELYILSYFWEAGWRSPSSYTHASITQVKSSLLAEFRNTACALHECACLHVLGFIFLLEYKTVYTQSHIHIHIQYIVILSCHHVCCFHVSFVVFVVCLVGMLGYEVVLGSSSFIILNVPDMSIDISF